MNPHPAGPTTRSMKRGDHHRPDYGQYAALVGHYVARQKLHIRDPDTYDLAGRLALKGHSSSPMVVLAKLSGGIVLPLLDPLASPIGEAFLFFSPSSGREYSSSSSSSGEESSSSSSDA